MAKTPRREVMERLKAIGRIRQQLIGRKRWGQTRAVFDASTLPGEWRTRTPEDRIENQPEFWRELHVQARQMEAETVMLRYLAEKEYWRLTGRRMQEEQA